jgi:hypothetical protein
MLLSVSVYSDVYNRNTRQILEGVDAYIDILLTKLLYEFGANHCQLT